LQEVATGTPVSDFSWAIHEYHTSVNVIENENILRSINYCVSARLVNIDGDCLVMFTITLMMMLELLCLGCRCVRVASLGVYLYEELTHETFHSKVPDTVICLLNILAVSG